MESSGDWRLSSYFTDPGNSGELCILTIYKLVVMVSVIFMHQVKITKYSAIKSLHDSINSLHDSLPSVAGDEVDFGKQKSNFLQKETTSLASKTVVESMF